MPRFLLLAALLGACQPSSETPSTDDAGEVVSRVKGVVVTGKDYEARANAAWGAADSTAVSADAAELVKKVGTPVLADVPAKFSGFDPATTVTDLRTAPGILPLLLANDDAAAAEAIRKTGAHVLVLHRTLGPSFDRDGRVLSRLYHHDALTHFQLARVEDDALYYLVVDAPLAFEAEIVQPAIAWLRERLSGKNPAPFPPLLPKRSDWRLIGVLRGQGQEMAFSLAEGKTLDRALVEVADDLEVMYRRQKEILGFPRLDLNMRNLTIELHRITESAFVGPRDEGSLADLWEMGIDGAVMLDRPTEAERKEGKKGQSAVWPGSVASTRGITKADQFLKNAAREFRWDSVRPWRDSDVELQLVRTKHWVEAPDGTVVEFERGTAKVPLESVTLATTRDLILLAGEWYLANLAPNGQVTYKFWPEDNRYSNEYNHVRHTLATWNLWQAWTLDPRPEFLEGAIRAQKWTLETLQFRDASSLKGWESAVVTKSPYADEIARDGMAYFTHGGNTKLGSVVVALLGMVEVAKATGDHSNDELMRKLGRFVMFMQEPSGTFRGYHVPEDHPYHDEVNDIVPGEAALALVYLAEYFDDPRYLDVLPKFFEYYKPWFHSRASTRATDAVWPAHIYKNDTRLELVQFGPWTVMAASAYTRSRPEAKDVAEFGLEVGRWMIDAYEYTSDRTPFPDYVGGYYKYEGELPAMQAFCYAEGTAAAYDMALRQKPEEAAFFELHTREAVRFAFAMQHDALDARPYSRAYQVIGGIKYAMNEPKVRIDYVHHGLSAAYQWLMAARTDPNLPASVKAEPDEALRRLLALQGMPSYRSGGPAAPPSTAAFVEEGATDNEIEE